MKLAGVFIFCGMISFSLSGCAALSASINRQAYADKTASEHGFKREIIPTPFFQLTTFSKINESGSPPHVYIEGDGYAWVSRAQLSDDPTPFQPVALYLAAKDSAENIVYLARPCQYTPFNLDPECRSEYWTDSRFSEKVVSSMNEAINHIKLASGAKEIHLVGYSGGAAIAVLLAARRDDIASLRTIAGNLDPEAVNRHHGVTPLKNSLNPMDVASQLSDLPQRHFVGGQDKTVPVFAAENFVRKLGDYHCAEIILVNEVDHTTGWTERWAELLETATKQCL